MRGIAHWFVLVTVAALALLGRPLDRVAVAGGDGDRASCREGDNLELRAARRDPPSIRLGDAGAPDGAFGVDIGPGYETAILVLLARDFAVAAASRCEPAEQHPVVISARGPPAKLA